MENGTGHKTAWINNVRKLEMLQNEMLMLDFITEVAFEIKGFQENQVDTTFFTTFEFREKTGAENVKEEHYMERIVNAIRCSELNYTVKRIQKVKNGIYFLIKTVDGAL